MLKYFKEAIGQYPFADYIQTISLVMFVMFFISVVAVVWLRPKNFYKEISELPLDNEN